MSHWKFYSRSNPGEIPYQERIDANSLRMKKAIEFSAKHDIGPEVQTRKLDELDGMAREMQARRANQRMAVSF